MTNFSNVTGKETIIEQGIKEASLTGLDLMIDGIESRTGVGINKGLIESVFLYVILPMAMFALRENSLFGDEYTGFEEKIDILAETAEEFVIPNYESYFNAADYQVF